MGRWDAEATSWKPVESLPPEGRRGVWGPLIEDFVASEAEYGEVVVPAGRDPSGFRAQLLVACGRKGVPVKAVLRGRRVFLVRTDMNDG